MTPRSCTGSCGRIAETLVHASGRSDHREGKTIGKVSSWRLFFLPEFMLKLAIFANQLLILALEFPLLSHARTAGAIGILGY